MTRIRSTDATGMDDRRGQSGGGGGGGGLGGLGSVLGGGGMKAGGGLIGIIVLLAAIFLPKVLGGGNSAQGASGNGSQAADAADGTCNSELEQVVCGVQQDVQKYWTAQLPTSFGAQYRDAPTTLFGDGVNTGCGQASSQTGPFYCPADEHVFIDLKFMQQLEQQLVGTTTDLAEQYIIAHEYGHHVQNILGTSAKVQQAEQGGQAKGHLFSEALELQADCYAGAWVGNVNSRGLLDSATEINEALDAAKGVGDDYIQSRGGGRVDPGTFTHGTSEQRQKWFRVGFDTQDPTQCAGTFAEMGVSI